jgi:nucleolar protein 6
LPPLITNTNPQPHTTMSVTALSKKQQKALLFRQKQKSKKTGEAIPGDVPEEDIQEDNDEAAPGDVGIAAKSTKGESSTAGAASSKKRKRTGEDKDAEGPAEDLTDGLKGKVKNVGKGKGKAWEEEGEDGEKSGKKSKKEVKQRFILFIGGSQLFGAPALS